MVTPTQSKPVFNELKVLQIENDTLKVEINRLTDKIEELKIAKTRFSYSDIKNQSDKVYYYTGLTPDQFEVLSCFSSKFELNFVDGWRCTRITKEDQLFMTLMKLRTNAAIIDLSERFKVSAPTVTNIVKSWILFLHKVLFESFMTIPSTRKNQACTPGCFSPFPNCRIILDCTEVQCAVPRGNFEDQRSTYSNYKARNTLKALVGVAPNGTITYVSDLFGGCCSDKQIVKKCGVLNHLVPGDLVITDKGFLIHNEMPPGVSLNMPPFLVHPQFTEQEAKLTVQIAKARIHVERAIGRIKNFSILNFIPASLYNMSSTVFQLCSALVNLQSPIISEITDQLATSSSS